MSETRSRQQTVTTMIGSLLVIEASALLVGAIVHLGVQIPLGIVVLEEPQILPATIVEGFCGLFLAGGAYAVFAQKSWAGKVVLVAQTTALGGVLLGIAALAVGAGPTTASNALFHRVMLVILTGGVVLFITPISRTTLNRGNRAS